MVLRVSHVLIARRKWLPLLTVLAVVALVMMPAQSAWASAPPTGETLTGTGVTTSGSAFGSCLYRARESGGASFTVPPGSSTATGPHAGRFSETGHFSISGYRNPPWKVSFNASFTITSGSTTITGTFSSPTYAWFSVGFICGSTGGVIGYGLNGPVNYTATINGQTYQGTGRVSGTFYTTAGAHDTLTESIMVTYGQIAGTVTDHATGAAIGGICVHAYNSGGGVLASAATNASGAYTLTNVPDGADWVGFSSGCGAANYLPQYYNEKASLASADPVTVTGGATTTGINAAMVTGGQITGLVTDRASGAPLTGICIQVYNSSGAVVASTQTNTSGAYTLSALATESYQVGFISACGADYYVTQYFNDKASLASADPIAVTAGTTTAH
jgi:5-hydroxyisourate hydrolase-like protein (transthyretin family)